MFGGKTILSAGLMALWAVLPGQAAAQADDTVGAASCLSRILPDAEVWSAEPGNGGWTNVGADLADTVLRADSLSCPGGQVQLDGVSLLPRLPVSQLLSAGAGFRADRLTLTLGDQTICGPLLSLRQMQVHKGRWFAWGSDDSQGYSELILRVDGRDIFKPTLLRLSAADVMVRPLPGRPSPCAFSYTTEMAGVEISRDSPLVMRAPQGKFEIAFPSSPADARGEREPPRMSGRLGGVEISDTNRQRVFSASDIALSAKGAAGKSLAASHLVEQRLMPFLREGHAPDDPRYTADLANALRFSEFEMAFQVPEMTFMPSWLMADIYQANFSTIMMQTASASMKSALRVLDGKAAGAIDFDVVGIGRSRTEFQATLPVFDRNALDGIRKSGKGPGAKALPNLQSLRIRFQDDGFSDAWTRLVGMPLIQSAARWASLPPGMGEVISSWVDRSRREPAVLLAEFPSPDALRHFLWGRVPSDTKLTVSTQ